MSDIFGGLHERDADSAYSENNNHESGWCVGHYGVTRIVVYRESGGLGIEPWLRIESDDGGRVFVSARFYCITFETKKGGDDGEV